MSFFFYLFKNLLNRPSYKFKLNLFFLKDSLSLNFKHLIYIHLFINLTNQLKVKIFKTLNYFSISYLYNYVAVINFILLLFFMII